MSAVGAALLLGGVVVALALVLVLLVRASRTKLPLGERPEGAPVGRRARRGVCTYCDRKYPEGAARCEGCGAPLSAR